MDHNTYLCFLSATCLQRREGRENFHSIKFEIFFRVVGRVAGQWRRRRNSVRLRNYFVYFVSKLGVFADFDPGTTAYRLSRFEGIVRRLESLQNIIPISSNLDIVSASGYVQ